MKTYAPKNAHGNLQLMTSDSYALTNAFQYDEASREHQAITLIKHYTLGRAQVVFTNSSYIDDKMKKLRTEIEELAQTNLKIDENDLQFIKSEDLPLNHKMQRLNDIITEKLPWFVNLAAFTSNKTEEKITNAEKLRTEWLYEKLSLLNKKHASLENQQICITRYKQTCPLFKLYTLTCADDNISAYISHFIEHSEKQNMIIVLNENDQPWTCVALKRISGNVMTYYLDPLGNSPSNDKSALKEIMITLRSFFLDPCVVFNKQNSIQSEEDNSIPLTIELASNLGNTAGSVDTADFALKAQKFKSPQEYQKLLDQHKQAYDTAAKPSVSHILGRADIATNSSTKQDNLYTESLLGKRPQKQHPQAPEPRTQKIKINNSPYLSANYSTQTLKQQAESKVLGSKPKRHFSEKEIANCVKTIVGKVKHATKEVEYFFHHTADGQFLLEFLSSKLEVPINFLSSIFHNSCNKSLSALQNIAQYLKTLDNNTISACENIKLKLNILGIKLSSISSILHQSNSSGADALIHAFDYLQGMPIAHAESINQTLKELEIQSTNITGAIRFYHSLGFKTFIQILDKIIEHKEFLQAITSYGKAYNGKPLYAIMKTLKAIPKNIVNNFETIIQALKSDDWQELTQSYKGNPYKLLTYLNKDNIDFFQKAITSLNEAYEGMPKNHDEIAARFNSILESLKHDQGDYEDSAMMMQQQNAADQDGDIEDQSNDTPEESDLNADDNDVYGKCSGYEDY
jgi:hypothetical protein